MFVLHLKEASLLGPLKGREATFLERIQHLSRRVSRKDERDASVFLAQIFLILASADI